jgi:hypothetical protein
MTLSFGIPSIGAIQRANAVLVAALAGILALAGMRDVAFGCVLGGAIVILNLYLLTILGRVLISAAAGAEGGSRARMGAFVLPLKLLMYAGLIYLVLSWAHVAPARFGLGFGLGVLTQFVAIVIETGRASLRGATT